MTITYLGNDWSIDEVNQLCWQGHEIAWVDDHGVAIGGYAWDSVGMYPPPRRVTRLRWAALALLDSDCTGEGNGRTQIVRCLLTEAEKKMLLASLVPRLEAIAALIESGQQMIGEKTSM